MKLKRASLELSKGAVNWWDPLKQSDVQINNSDDDDMWGLCRDNTRKFAVTGDKFPRLTRLFFSFSSFSYYFIIFL